MAAPPGATVPLDDGSDGARGLVGAAAQMLISMETRRDRAGPMRRLEIARASVRRILA